MSTMTRSAYQDVANPHERVVRVRQTSKKGVRVFFAIRDAYVGCWRGRSLICESDAWTRDLQCRAEFKTPRQARRELKAIWGWRQGAA